MGFWWWFTKQQELGSYTLLSSGEETLSSKAYWRYTESTFKENFAMILLLIQNIVNSGKWLRMPVNIKEAKKNLKIFCFILIDYAWIT